VLAKDVVASLNRWAARDQMGLMLKAIEQELSAPDDRTIKWVLKKPYPKMLLALGKNNAPVAFVMPERIAKTDPFKQISEYIGSGPMKFAKSEWVPGAKSVFEKFAGYVPRQEPASWLAGGKRILIDRVEWVVMPDPGTASAALQNGEIDWWENPISDLVPLLRKNRNVVVDIADPLGNVGSFRMDHLYPPFNDVRARRAILMAMSQEDYMRAIVGDDDKLWRPLPGFFTPNTALYRGGRRHPQGSAQVRCGEKAARRVRLCRSAGDLPRRPGPADHQGARRRHRRSPQAARHERRLRGDRLGHRRRPPRPEDAARSRRLADVPHLACRRRHHQPGALSRDPRQWRQGVVRLAQRAGGRDRGLCLVDAKNLDEEKAAIRRLNKAVLDNVIYAPTGFFLGYQAWRKNVSGIVKGPLPFFWDVAKA
jgi:peptide/nickel transport system substrate-binding protein